MGTIKEWTCPKCKRITVSRNRIFKCVSCGYEPPIEDYKKAFEDLKMVYEASEKDAASGYRAISRSRDMYKKEADFYKAIIIGLLAGLLILILTLLRY